MSGVEQKSDGLEVYVKLLPWSGSEMMRNGKPYQAIPGGLQRLHDSTLQIDQHGFPVKTDEALDTYQNNVQHAGHLAVRVTSWRDWYAVTAPEDVSEAVFIAHPEDPGHHVVGGVELTEQVRESAGSIPCVLTGELLREVGILYPGETEISWIETTMGAQPNVAPEVLGKATPQFQS